VERRLQASRLMAVLGEPLAANRRTADAVLLMGDLNEWRGRSGAIRLLDRRPARVGGRDEMRRRVARQLAGREHRLDELRRDLSVHRRQRERDLRRRQRGAGNATDVLQVHPHDPLELRERLAPGFDDRQVRTPGTVVDRAGGATYDLTWQAALSVAPPWILVSSWNEWHEGSEIEPSVEHGRRYLDATRAWAERFRRGGP